MNRRRFLELMGIGIGSSAIVYSFPTIIVPKNIVIPAPTLQVFDVRALSAAQRLYVERAMMNTYTQELLAERSLLDEIRSNFRGRRMPYNWTDSV